jgi:hypothetical protein
MTDAPDVSTVSKEASDMHTAAALPRALMGGTTTMRAAGKTYLPKQTAESEANYTARLGRTFLFNAFGKTVEDMTGKVFTKPIVLEDDVPTELQGFAENIDQTGRHLNVFARDVMLDAFQPGIGYILADMPPALPAGSTLADEQAAGLRPYLVYIPIERVLGWKSENIGGVETLTMFRFKECVSEPDGEFVEKEIEQIRVLERGKWRTFRKSSGDKKQDVWVQHQEGKTAVSSIPISPVYLKRLSFMTGTPPLAKIAELNVAHWQSSSDQRNILHVARVPILAMYGVSEDDKIAIGSSEAVRFSNPDASMEYVEHTGAAIEAGAKDIKELELQMQAMGLQLLIDAPGGQSATGEIRDDAKENSPLAMMAGALGDAIELALGFMAEFQGLGKDAGGSVVVNTDFGISTMDVPQVVACYSAGLIDAQTGIDELKRRGFLSGDVDAEVVMERLKNQMALEAKTAMDLQAAKGSGGPSI